MRRAVTPAGLDFGSAIHNRAPLSTLLREHVYHLRTPSDDCTGPIVPARPILDLSPWLTVTCLLILALTRQPLVTGLELRLARRQLRRTVVLLQRRYGFALLLKRRAKPEMSYRQARHSSKGCLFFGDLPLPVAQMPESIAEAAVRIRRAGLQPDRFAILACGAVPTRLARMDRTEFGVCRGHTGV